MARRPVFIPNYVGDVLVAEKTFEIKWAPWFSLTQKQKNVISLHAEAKKFGLKNILEISSKSDKEVGRRLSSFSIKVEIQGRPCFLESVYQSSKVFEQGGPFSCVLDLSPLDAKRFTSDAKLGRLVRFEYNGVSYPLSPKNAFYDWLYIRSLAPHSEWIGENIQYDAYTDIEFNPLKQVNCQARAFAEYVSLLTRGRLGEVTGDFELFSSMLYEV